MSNKPKSVTKATPEEVANLSKRSGPGAFAWEFPDYMFDGEWYKVQVRSQAEVKSAAASFRAQVKFRLEMRAQAYMNLKENIFFVRSTNIPHGSKGKIPMNGKLAN